MLAVWSQQPFLVSELKSVSKNRKSSRTWRNASPWAPDVSNEYDGGEKAYKETNVVCEQLSQQMVEEKAEASMRNGAFAHHSGRRAANGTFASCLYRSTDTWRNHVHVSVLAYRPTSALGTDLGIPEAMAVER